MKGRFKMRLKVALSLAERRGGFGRNSFGRAWNAC